MAAQAQRPVVEAEVAGGLAREVVRLGVTAQGPVVEAEVAGGLARVVVALGVTDMTGRGEEEMAARSAARLGGVGGWGAVGTVATGKETPPYACL